MRRVRGHQPSSRGERGWGQVLPVAPPDPETDSSAAAGMDPAAWGAGTAIAWDRSGAGSLVIVVGGGVQGRVIGAATAQQPGPVLVVVVGGWPVRVLPAAAGPLHARLVDGLGLAIDDRRPLLPEGDLAGRAGPGSPRRRRAVEEAEPQAAGPAFQAGGNVFRREGEYWTICYEGTVVRLRDTKGLRHLARLLTHPGREFHAVDLEAANRQAGSPPAVGREGRAGAGELVVRPDLGDAGALLDATAKVAYQARLTELGAELEEAEAGNDPPAPPAPEPNGTFWSPSWPERSGWAAATAGRPPTPSGPD